MTVSVYVSVCIIYVVVVVVVVVVVAAVVVAVVVAVVAVVKVHVGREGTWVMVVVCGDSTDLIHAVGHLIV